MSAKLSQDNSRPWWTRFLNRRLQFMLDVLVLVAAFVLSYMLRFDFDIPDTWQHNALVQLPYVVLSQLAVMNLTGGRSFIWRYTSIAHLRSFLYAAALSFLIILSLRFGIPEQFHQWRVPVSVCIIDQCLAFGGALGLRVFRRALYERYEKRKRQRSSNGYSIYKKPVLLIGAGQAGVLAASEIERRGDMDLLIKGFVDDDPGKQKRSVIKGIKVLGAISDLPRLVRQLGIDHVVITICQASRQEIQKIVAVCESIPISVRIIPGLYEILDGRIEVSRFREVQIEDLLGREPVRLDEEGLALFLAGKRVMVTGAGGSIGSELARQVSRFHPESLLLVERAENALFNTDRELRELAPGHVIETLVADISDERRMRAIFETHRPQVILHAAAHKHVPLMEQNPAEAVKNNVLTTRSLGVMANEYGAEVFVLISTDKAVCPSSIMGATKRVAELVIQELNRRSRTRFVAVRFGNVIGSAGSVIPIFREQIRKGGPVTITDKRMKRYFMTIPEAAQLVLQAGAIGKNSTGGEVFILKMGEPVSIMELAEALITLSGFKPHEDIRIVETGQRPGEKLYEELVFTEEEVAGTEHPKIFINRIAHRPTEDMRHALERLTMLSKEGHEAELRVYLNELLPEANLTLADKALAEMGEEKAVAQAAAAGEDVAYGKDVPGFYPSMQAS
ncbi:MAG: polysaccharide biosynthesis protein [Pyrinomonadaceae bacterium]|nr:polysaccharide biosynthesis protein [Pyrinomonadaceae bacterium]